MALWFHSFPNPQKEQILSFPNRAIIQACFIKANLIKCQSDRQSVSVAAEREVIGWGNHYDNNHN